MHMQLSFSDTWQYLSTSSTWRIHSPQVKEAQLTQTYAMYIHAIILSLHQWQIIMPKMTKKRNPLKSWNVGAKDFYLSVYVVSYIRKYFQ